MFGSTSNSSGSGLFGSNNNAGSGLFGGAKPASTGFGSAPGGTNTGFGTNTTTNANTGGGGLFGSNNNTNTAGASTNTASGGLFGSTNNNSAGGSNTGQPASGGLFGSQNNTNTSSGGLFGANTNNTASNSSGGLFGNSNANASNNTNNASTNTSGGLFGSTGNTSNTGGGLFGSNNANNNTTSGNTGANGGLFGNKPASSGGLFGSSNNTSNTGGGLFGSNNASGSTSGGLFGSNNNATGNNTGSGGLFGSSSSNTQQQQPPSSQQSGGLFGQNNTNSQPSGGLFGQNTTNNQQPSFGWSNQNQTSNQTSQPLFDTTNKLNNPNLNNPNSNFNSSNNAASNYNNYTPAINDQLIKIKEQWDPNSAKCALKTHLYNKLNDQEINILLSQQRPSNESPEDWDNAMSNRPSPHHYPIKVTSFTDVAQRIETQLEYVAKSRILLNGINEKQSSLSSKHDLDNTTRILKAKARHVKLLRRLLRLATVLAILKLKGYPLLPEEEELSKQFDLLNQKLNDPNGSLGKLNDVFARLAILKERSEDLSYQFDSSLNSMNNVHGNNIEPDSEKDVIDDSKNNDEVINKLSKLLLKQQVGLNHLNNVLEKDLESVNKLTIKN